MSTKQTENKVRAIRAISTAAGDARSVEPEELGIEPTYGEQLRDKLRRGAEVLDKPRTSWLVRDWLPARGIGVLFGPPGSGKSFYALSLALEIARGGEWCGEQLEPATVLYVAAERAEVLGDRQEAWCAYHRAQIPETFYELAAAPPLNDGAWCAALEQLVAELRPDLVVIDTLAQVTLGVNENDGAEWGNIGKALGRIRDASEGGTVLAVHHTGKDTSRGMRGHTALLGGADITLELEARDESIVVSVDKVNAGREPLPEWYRLERLLLDPLPGGEVARDAAVLVASSSAVSGSGAPSSRRSDLLVLLAGDFEDTGITRVQVQTSLNVSINTAANDLRKLKQSGLIESTGTGAQVRYFITDRGREHLEREGLGPE